MSGNESLRQVLQSHLSGALSGWSMGSFGALAEFNHDRNEPILIEDENTMTLATRRGAIHLNVWPIFYFDNVARILRPSGSNAG